MKRVGPALSLSSMSSMPSRNASISSFSSGAFRAGDYRIGSLQQLAPPVTLRQHAQGLLGLFSARRLLFELFFHLFFHFLLAFLNQSGWLKPHLKHQSAATSRILHSLSSSRRSKRMLLAQIILLDLLLWLLQQHLSSNASCRLVYDTQATSLESVGYSKCHAGLFAPSQCLSHSPGANCSRAAASNNAKPGLDSRIRPRNLLDSPQLGFEFKSHKAQTTL